MKIRLAVFISTVEVTTGALAGGLENKTLIQELALFKHRTCLDNSNLKLIAGNN